MNWSTSNSPWASKSGARRRTKLKNWRCWKKPLSPGCAAYAAQSIEKQMKCILEIWNVMVLLVWLRILGVKYSASPGHIIEILDQQWFGSSGYPSDPLKNVRMFGDLVQQVGCEGLRYLTRTYRVTWKMGVCLPKALEGLSSLVWGKPE